MNTHQKLKANIAKAAVVGFAAFTLMVEGCASRQERMQQQLDQRYKQNGDTVSIYALKGLSYLQENYGWTPEHLYRVREICMKLGGYWEFTNEPENKAISMLGDHASLLTKGVDSEKVSQHFDALRKRYATNELLDQRAFRHELKLRQKLVEEFKKKFSDTPDEVIKGYFKDADEDWPDRLFAG